MGENEVRPDAWYSDFLRDLGKNVKPVQNTHKIQTCCCRAPLNITTGADNLKVGDLSICVYCGTVAIFSNSQLDLIPLTESIVNRFPKQLKNQVKSIRQIIFDNNEKTYDKWFRIIKR